MQPFLMPKRLEAISGGCIYSFAGIEKLIFNAFIVE